MRKMEFEHKGINYVVRVVEEDCGSIRIRPFRIEDEKEVLVSPVTYDVPGDVALSARRRGLDLVADLLEQAKQEVIDDAWGQYQEALRDV